MQPSDLKSEIKALLVAELHLAGRDPRAIDDEALLFGESRSGGLGLDSLDALQIAMLLEERFGVRVPDGDEARPIFRSVSSLAEFIARARAAGAVGAPPG
jgi:acyl carrier protein